MQVQEFHESPLYDSSSFIPANYDFFNIVLVTEVHNSKLPHGEFIVPFKTHEITFGEVLHQLLILLRIDKQYPLNKFRLNLREGVDIKKKETAEELRIKLCRESASGITIIAKEIDGIQDQACVNFYYENQPDCVKEKVRRLFMLLNNFEPFDILIAKTIKFSKLTETIVKALNHYYENEVKSNQVKFYKLEKNKNENKLEWIKKQEIKDLQVERLVKGFENQVIGIEVDKGGCHWPTSQVNNQEFLIVNLTKDDKIKLKFSLYINYTVKQLLYCLNIEKSHEFGIKVVNDIYKPYQLIKELSKHFEIGEGKFVKNVECRLISEREMFYSSMKNIAEDFIIQKEMITKKKENHFEECQKIARDRTEQFRDSPKMPFNSQKQVSPITLYTSSVQVIENDSSIILYKGLNLYLRGNPFGMQSNYKGEWKYKYSATLIRSLQKIVQYGKEQIKTTYRGVANHLLEGQVGQIYIEKQFCSTSYEKKPALTFLKSVKFGTFITFKGRTGRLIEIYSFYKEKEVLYLPFTHFRIIERINPTETDPYLYLTLQQIVEQQYQSNPATIVLWIDDKKKEGEKVIQSLDCPMHTTFLHQLTSNERLLKWIEDNQSIIKNPRITIAVITNMRRVEEGKDEKTAGAKTYKIVKEKLPQSKIIFYIGHIDGTKKALADSEINPQSVPIFNKRIELRDFIASVTRPNEEKEGESVVDKQKKLMLRYFSQIKSTKSQISSTI